MIVKKLHYFLVFSVLFLSCNSHTTENYDKQKQHLNGKYQKILESNEVKYIAEHL